MLRAAAILTLTVSLAGVAVAQSAGADLDRRQAAAQAELERIGAAYPNVTSVEQRDALDRRREAAMAEIDRVGDARIALEKAKADARDSAIRAEQEKRAAEDEAARSLAEARSKDPAWFIPALSAAICSAQRDRAGALRSIADHKRLARQGAGIVDLKELYSYQEDIGDANKRESAARAELRARHAKALACSKPMVRAISDCLQGLDCEGNAKAFVSVASIM